MSYGSGNFVGGPHKLPGGDPVSAFGPPAGLDFATGGGLTAPGGYDFNPAAGGLQFQSGGGLTAPGVTSSPFGGFGGAGGAPTPQSIGALLMQGKFGTPTNTPQIPFYKPQTERA